MKYIQSLQRAFDILELLSDESQRSFSLGEIAHQTGLHPATCSHLVSTMVDRGYVESAGSRQGYRLGIMSHYLNRNRPHGGELVARAQPLLAAAAEELGEWVVLTTMAGTQRLVLLELNGSSRAVQIDRAASRLAERAYDSASIWLFLAYLEPAMRQRFIACHGQPDDWPDAAAFEERLAAVRNQQHCIYRDPSGEEAKISFPVWEGDRLTAAVGVHLPAFRFVGDHRSRIMGVLEKLAAELGNKGKG